MSVLINMPKLIADRSVLVSSVRAISLAVFWAGGSREVYNDPEKMYRRRSWVMASDLLR